MEGKGNKCYLAIFVAIAKATGFPQTYKGLGGGLHFFAACSVKSFSLSLWLNDSLPLFFLPKWANPLLMLRSQTLNIAGVLQCLLKMLNCVILHERFTIFSTTIFTLLFTLRPQVS